MEKFPLDVATAERLTDGDPNIITHEDFMPQSKKGNQSCWADIFKTDRKSITSPNKSSLKVNKSELVADLMSFKYCIVQYYYLNFKVHLHQKKAQQ